MDDTSRMRLKLAPPRRRHAGLDVTATAFANPKCTVAIEDLPVLPCIRTRGTQKTGAGAWLRDIWCAIFNVLAPTEVVAGFILRRSVV